ncbi:polysaccharide deacetylase [Clostridiaceae bacterium UIB06]|uniref:Polysaccharide deacetylase n=2 Tax=Clostridium thailandense TaxID=2794346 RepID=A0A949WSB6_9CLOT|nr:polysaccharide deacetylase [Clostridium thailandense]MCH5137904.1 polysaccharide deacetylase [Clostridiaceae bacterium UIB06]
MDSPVKTAYESEKAKEVFLTFDDGPCNNNTKKILNILKDNNIKATFFIIGTKGEENPQILKELSDNGMSVGVHTYSHKYNEIYKNTDSYFKDYYNCQRVIRRITGRDPAPYLRMPGGSDNLVASKKILDNIKNILRQKDLKYVDWNVSSGDAESCKVSVEKIKKNVIDQCKNKKIAVILMHDTYYKNTTVEALPYIVKTLKDEGFIFKTFDDITQNEETQMVKMRVINRISI